MSCTAVSYLHCDAPVGSATPSAAWPLLQPSVCIPAGSQEGQHPLIMWICLTSIVCRTSGLSHTGYRHKHSCASLASLLSSVRKWAFIFVCLSGLYGASPVVRASEGFTVGFASDPSAGRLHLSVISSFMAASLWFGFSLGHKVVLLIFIVIMSWFEAKDWRNRWNSCFVSG